MENYLDKHLDGAGLEHLIDMLDVRYASSGGGGGDTPSIDVETETIKYLGTTTGAEVIQLPSSFTELFAVASQNAWNNLSFSIPAEALKDNTAVASNTGVPGGSYYKAGSYLTLNAATSVYADNATFLISKTRAKLSEWMHNEGNVVSENYTDRATTMWFYRTKVKISDSDSVSGGEDYESITNDMIDDWWNS